jgi:hypothetical protein
MGDDMEVSDKLTALKIQLHDHETRLEVTEGAVDEILYRQNVDRIRTLLDLNNRKLRVYHLKWTMAELKTKDLSKKKDFILAILRQAFVNPDLLKEQDLSPELVSSIKPTSWKSGVPLDIEFSSMEVVQHIMNNVAGKRLNFPIRPWLPKILMARYDEMMKARSALREATPGRRIYVDIIPSDPFVIMVEKTADEKREVQMKWEDERLADPVHFYRSWSYIPRSDTAVKTSGGPSEPQSSSLPVSNLQPGSSSQSDLRAATLAQTTNAQVTQGKAPQGEAPKDQFQCKRIRIDRGTPVHRGGKTSICGGRGGRGGRGGGVGGIGE